MELKRRGFLKALTSGLALRFAVSPMAFALNAAGVPSGELETSSGTLHLKGRLKSGVLTLSAHDFLDLSDRSVIVRGRLGVADLYSAMFSCQKDLTVFALFRDHGHSTSLVLSDTSEPNIGRAIVWNDNDSAQTYNLDKRDIIKTQSPKEVRDQHTGKSPDLVGSRKPPAFTWQELESVFGNDAALLRFMRGNKSSHPGSEPSEWACRLLSMVPGSMLSLFWLAYYPLPNV